MKLKKIWILQKGVAHFEGLLSWKTRDSPKGFVCSSSLRGIFTARSRSLTAHAQKTIVIRAPTHLSLMASAYSMCGCTHHTMTRRPFKMNPTSSHHDNFLGLG